MKPVIKIGCLKQRFLYSTISRFSPGLKRLMMLASLMAGISEHSSEQQFVKNLDKALNLSKGSESSLIFPLRLSKVFWGDLAIYRREIETIKNTSICIEKRRQAAKTLLEATPKYFIYAPLNELVDDILRYFDYTAKLS